MYTVKIATLKQFQESKEIWNRLASEMVFPSIFCTWEWVYTWWEHFGESYEPVIFFVCEDEEIKAILPLVSRPALSKTGLLGNVLYYCGSPEVYPDHLDLIAAKEDAELCMEAIFRFLSSEYHGWDVLYLSHLSQESILLSCMNKVKLSFHTEINKASVSPFITFSEGFDGYMNAVDSQVKNTIKRGDKKLAERFGINYMCCAPSCKEEGLRMLFALHEKRANSKNVASTFKGARFFDFHNDLQERIDKNGWLWLNFLGNEDKIISAFYGFAYGNRLSYYQMGFDPEWSKYSPGAVLLNKVITDAWNNGYEEFDFLCGDETYKREWTRNCRVLTNVKLYNKTILGGLSRGASSARYLMKSALRKSSSRINENSAAY